jgi:Ca2+-binding EF-hand superfamily protein
MPDDRGLGQSAASGARKSPRAALKVARKLGVAALNRFSFRMRAKPPASPARVGPRKKKEAAPSSQKQGQQQRQQRAAAAAFAKFDANGDGSLTFKEAVTCFRTLAKDEGLESVLSSEFLEGAFEQFDTDGDGKIDSEEFEMAHTLFVEWLKEERAMEEEEMAANESPASKPVEMAEAQLMKDIETQIESSQPAAKRDPADNQAKAELRKLLDGATHRVVFSDDERRRLGCKFLRASCGFSQGKQASFDVGELFDAESLEKLLEKSESHSLGKAKITVERFRRLAAEAFGVRTPFLQESLFRVCRPGKDAKLTFLEFLRGIAPAAKGTREERGAFMFTLYDADEQGSVCLTELRTMFSRIEVDCVVKQDLVRFSQHASENKLQASGGGYRYPAYLAHVDKHGESALITSIQRSLK